MAEKGSGERTEKASARRIRKARSDGAISHSREVGSWASLLISTFVIPGVLKSLMATSESTMTGIAGIIRDPGTAPAMALARSGILRGAQSVMPLAVLIMVTSVASSAMQGGVHVAPKLWMPKFSRLNPIQGIKRSFGPHGLWELAKSMGKIGVIGAVAYSVLRGLIPTLASSGSMPLQVILIATTTAALQLLRFASAAGILLSATDVIVVRRRNNKQLKMTKQEVKEEHKSNEGDPRLKGAIRSKALEMSRNRMMADIPQADVVVVNPTHVAVALKYEPAKGAPRVVAKGADHVATRIRELAIEARVPMVADIALARTIYATCDIGQEIPPQLYQGVATVLAFVMRLKRRGSAAGLHRI
jgi:flagellar biosynthetic protein FlhB